MLRKVQATIERHGMFPAGSRVVVAVSGGPDSVCLLHALRELAPHLNVTLAGVAHLNHKLRGAASDEDERFVAELANEFGLAFFSRSAAAGELSGNLEQAARRVRRSFFRDLLDQGVAHRIALGHTQDDQAETVLFRLLRGSGPGGLSGILPVTREGLVRPLLDVSRDQVRSFLQLRQIESRQDASNLDLKFVRNRIRHVLLPELASAWNPQISTALAQLADLSYEDEQWLTQRLAPEFEGLLFESDGEADGALELDLASITGRPLGFTRRLLRYAIQRVKGDLSGIHFQHLEAAVRLATGPEGGGRLVLPRIKLTRSFHQLRIAAGGSVPRLAPTAVVVPGVYSLAECKALIRLHLAKSPSGPVDALRRCDPCATLRVRAGEPLVLRGWEPGDEYHPEASARPRKMKELFQTARVPSWRRPCWPILTTRGKIIWAKDFGAAKQYSTSQLADPSESWDLVQVSLLSPAEA